MTTISIPAAMAPFARRRLTAGERSLAAEIFGATFDPDRVGLLALPVWRRAFVAGPRLMVWPARAARADFSTASLAEQAVFVHELTHVWQAQNGVWLPMAKLRAGDSVASYAYDLVRGPAFVALNIEQQAAVVEHAFLARHGHPTPFPANRYATLGEPWRRG